MAVNVEDIQKFLGSDDDERSRFRSDSGAVGRVWVDGVVVIYDLDDIPAWLGVILKAQDEDGDTGLDTPRTNEKDVSRQRIDAGR